MTILPGLNYDSKLSVDDLTFSSEQTEEAILDRFKLVFGTGALTPAKSGIVDSADPQGVVETDQDSRPLLVYTSSSDPLKVNIAPGITVNADGSIVAQTTLIEEFELARTNANDIVVVFAENVIEDAGPTRITRYNTAQPTRRVQSDTKIYSALLTDYQNTSIFTPSRKDGITVLAVIKVVETVSSSLELVFDYTDTVYSFNRPWFSPVDIEHRSKIGSGETTDRNPHGLTYNDLSSGNLTLYDQVLPIGAIQSRDDDIKGSPGIKCQETITPSRVLTDGTGGSVTAGSRFGGANANYIVLAQYPGHITAFYLQTKQGRDISFDLIRGTKIVVLPHDEVITEDAIIEYTTVSALEPPQAILSNLITFGQPNVETELIFTGGITVSEIANPSIQFDGTGPVPEYFDLYLNPEGYIYRNPEVIGTTILLDDVGTIKTAVDYTFLDLARVQIGLADANTVSTMAITIRLYGLDENDTAFSEDVSFSGSTWSNVVLPGVPTPSQSISSSNLFKTLTDIQILSRTDDGPSAKITLRGRLKDNESTGLNKLARHARITWDGLAVSEIIDIRNVSPTIPAPENRYLAAGEVLGAGGTAPTTTFVEDMVIPRRWNSTVGSFDATQATFQVIINDYTQYAGVSLTLFNGKVLTPVAIAPNRTIGQFLASGSNQDTRDDLILTLNFTAFNSGITAVAGTASDTVDCTVVQTGAQGNGENVITPALQSFISTTDAEGGIDGFSESFIPRHQKGIDTQLPSTGVYEVFEDSGRYLSQAIAIGGRNVNGVEQIRNNIEIALHGVPPPKENGQVRIRPCLGTNPEWLPWEVMTQDGSKFSYGPTTDKITKIQIEIFGKCDGFTLLEN